MNRRLTVPDALTLHVLWHDGDDAGVIKLDLLRGMIVTWTQQSHFARSICCERSSTNPENSFLLCVKPGTVPLRVVVFGSLNMITQRRFWKTL